MNELLEKFRAEYPQYADMPDADLLVALHQRFYSDMPFAEFSERVGLTQKNTGPTPQPPFPSLPPMVGGALDALVAFGTGAGLGLPLLAGDTREYMGELMERAPGATLAAAGAGALAGGALGARGGAGLMSRLRPPPPVPAPIPPNPMLPPWAGIKSIPTPPAAPGIGARAGSIAKDLMLKRLLPGGLAAEALRRLIGG